MKSEHLFIIRLGDGRHFEYEGTLDGAKRKASKLATPPVAIQLLAEQRLVATRRPYFGWDGKVGWHPWELLERKRIHIRPPGIRGYLQWLRIMCHSLSGRMHYCV